MNGAATLDAGLRPAVYRRTHTSKCEVKSRITSIPHARRRSPPARLPKRPFESRSNRSETLAPQSSRIAR